MTTTITNIITKNFTPTNNFRYERKFTLSETHRNFPLQIIRNNPTFFKEIYQPRQVNNIYFDTSDLEFYEANVIGLADRKKVRIRWYGNTFGQIEQPVLEFKIKQGLVGDKWSWQLPPFVLDENFYAQTVQNIWQNADLPLEILEQVLNLQPTLQNSYQRTYFLSADKNFRLTFDEKLIYRKIQLQNNQVLHVQKTPQNFILELKYSLENDKKANAICRHFPMRLDKSSKYVNGIDLVG